MKQIIITKPMRDLLIKTFAVNRVTVWAAMNYKRDTESHRRMRKFAIENGGKVVGGEELITEFKEGKMIQTYGTVRIEVELGDHGRVFLYENEKEIGRWSDMSLDAYVKLQQRAKLLSEC